MALLPKPLKLDDPVIQDDFDQLLDLFYDDTENTEECCNIAKHIFDDEERDEFCEVLLNTLEDHEEYELKPRVKKYQDNSEDSVCIKNERRIYRRRNVTK